MIKGKGKEVMIKEKKKYEGREMVTKERKDDKGYRRMIKKGRNGDKEWETTIEEKIWWHAARKGAKG